MRTPTVFENRMPYGLFVSNDHDAWTQQKSTLSSEPCQRAEGRARMENDIMAPGGVVLQSLPCLCLL